MDVQNAIGELFSHARNVGFEGIVQFKIDGATECWFDVSASVPLRKGSGVHAQAAVCLELSSTDLMGVLDGELNIEDLFSSGNLVIGGDFGLATLLPQLIHISLRGGQGSSEVVANGRYPASPRPSDRLSANQPPVLTVARRGRAELSVAEFRHVYMRQGIPVIIGNALDDWTLFTGDRQVVGELFRGVQGFSRHGDYVNKAFSTERDFRSIAMIDYLDALGSIDGNRPAALPPAYMGNNILPSALFAHINYPEYFARHQYIRPRLWLGPKGTLTPLHRDDSDNLFAQVWGSKRFVLAAPHHREALGTWSTSPDGGLEGCDVDPQAPDLDRFPGAGSVRFLDIVLHAGELLFIPEGWFHQVESLSTSLSINFWVNSGRGWKDSPLPDEPGKQ